MLITHRIAGITFRLDADVPLPHLNREPYNLFGVEVEAPEPDIASHFCEYDPARGLASALTPQERDRVARTIGFPPQWIDRPELLWPAVSACLRAGLDRPELLHVGIMSSRVIIRDFARNRLDVVYAPERRRDFSDGLIVAGYRNLLAAFLPNFDALLVHSSAALRHGAAAVFLAADEGGKTSVVAQLPAAAVLNDDQVILRRAGATVVAHGTPFGPLSSGPQQAPLRGFFLLEKASRFELTPVPAREMLQFLWNEHAHLWFLLPKSLRRQSFDLLAAACRQAANYRLCLPPAYVDWDAIDAVLAR